MSGSASSDQGTPACKW